MKKITLKTIAEKYSSLNYNDDNYYIGGGLDDSKFASRRHEEARNDAGKLTLGEATQLFKKATCLEIEEIREIINYAVPNMEWHHAGKLPKSYGGGMKKTYFLNAKEICDLAKNFNSYEEKLSISLAKKKEDEEKKRDLEQRKFNFLMVNAKRFIRSSNTPAHRFYILTEREMHGKYGWFDSRHKSYNLPEYFSGWEFETEEKYNEFLNIQ